MSRDCPDAVELTRASSEGADAALTAHLAGCARCAAEWRALAQVVALVREAPPVPIEASRRESVRTAVLLAASASGAGGANAAGGASGASVAGGASGANAASGARRLRTRRIVVGVTFAAAAAIVVGVWLGREPGRGLRAEAPPPSTTPAAPGVDEPRVDAPRVPAPRADVPPPVVGPSNVSPPILAPAPPAPRVVVAPSRVASADVVAEPGARFVRLDRDGLEVIRVEAGRVRVVAGKTPVRVESYDGAIRITDASVVIAADGERLVSVEVQRGEVILERRGAASLEMATGARWERPEATAPLAPPAPLTPPAEAEFQAGLDALRRGDHAAAAAAFARAAAAPDAGALAEDAHFWRGVALARAGHDTDAETALRAFLRGYPRSARAGEASAILGWLLVERGALADAEPLFRAAARDTVPAVRDSGERGLRELARRRAPAR